MMNIVARLKKRERSYFGWPKNIYASLKKDEEEYEDSKNFYSLNDF